MAHSQKQADMMEDVFLSHIFIIENCPSNINFISIEQIHDLVERDDEKYRIELTKWIKQVQITFQLELI